MQAPNLSACLMDGEIENEYGKNKLDSKYMNCMAMPSAKQETGLSDVNKSKKSSFVQKNLELHLSDSQRSKIECILNSVKELSDTEKLLLYLKLPTREDDVPSTSPANTKQEQTFAFQWIRNNLEECNNSVNLPKHEVYDDYKSYCEGESLTRYLSAPDFGKIVKCIFPNVKARRLGTRGNSKYCYSGLQRKVNTGEVQGSSVTNNDNFTEDVSDSKCIKAETHGDDEDACEQTYAAASVLVCEWANKLLGRMFETLIGLAKFLVSGSYVSTKSMASFIVMSATEETVKIMNSKYSFDALVNPPLTTAMATKTQTVIKTEALSPSTPSKRTEKVSVQSNEVNSTSDSKKLLIGAQVVPDMLSTASSDLTSGSSQCEKIKLHKFTIDVSSPVFLGNTSQNSLLPDNMKEEDILMDNVNVVILDKNQDENLNLNPSCSKSTINVPQTNPSCKVQSSSGCVKRRKKKVDKVLLNSSHLKNAMHPHIANNMDSFDTFNNYSPIPLSSSIQAQHNAIFPWQGSPGDVASPPPLSEIEMQNMFANPENQLDFPSNLQRCHSFPVVSKQKCVETDKTFTPQFNGNNHSAKQTFKVKRNLSNMFNDSNICKPNANANDYFSRNSSSLQNVPNMIPNMNSRSNKERVVPTEPLKNIRPFNVDMSMRDDDFSGIASNQDHVDGHELLKNFQSSGNWLNDWSNMTMPVMNFS